MTQPQPTPAEPFPQPIELPGGPCVDDPIGLRYDRGDLEETSTRTAGAGWAVTGRDPIAVQDLGCGHLPGDVHDDSCAYWRGVLTGEYQPPEAYMAEVISLPPFNLRELAAQGITAAEQDRRERGAA